jgi:glyoxylase-like metal-dependent hydrolase (beta-lactamase superfamily II)
VKLLKIAALALLALFLFVKFVLLTARSLPEKARFALDISALRQAAGPLDACPENANASFGPKLKLTQAQRRPLGMSGVSRDLSGEATLESGPEGSLHPVAPGIVAITAAGHTPGSQMLFLRLKSGREILLTGDVAWQEATLEQHSPRARLVSWIMREDDEAITHQLRAILDLKRSTPSLDVVVAHDIPAMDRRFAAGSVGSAFR